MWFVNINSQLESLAAEQVLVGKTVIIQTENKELGHSIHILGIKTCHRTFEIDIRKSIENSYFVFGNPANPLKVHKNQETTDWMPKLAKGSIDVFYDILRIAQKSRDSPEEVTENEVMIFLF